MSAFGGSIRPSSEPRPDSRSALFCRLIPNGRILRRESMTRAYLRVVAFLVMVLSAQAGLAQDLPNRHVLLLYSHEREMDSYEPLDRALRSTLEADPRFTLEF